MKKHRVSLIGAGSRYTPGILQMLVHKKDEFPMESISLYDIDANRNKVIGDYAQILFKEYYPECEVIVTEDKKTAYEGIDFAFMQIRAGRLPMREQDEKIPLKYDRVGQETCGAGGLAYGMRSVPQVMEIFKDIRHYAPDAWILNYSNPAAIVAEATKREFPDDHKIINICDMPFSIMNNYAQILGVDIKYLEPRYFGLNHYGWFTHILDKRTGYDYLPELKKYYTELEQDITETAEGSDASWIETFNFMKSMIKDYDDFLPSTYLQYYLYPDHIVEISDKNYTRANEVMDGSEKRAFEMCRKVVELGKLKETEFAPDFEASDAHAGYITDLANSISNNEKEIFLVITENKGAVNNLTEGMMVEVPCMVGSNGVEPLQVGDIPAFQKGLLENQYACEKLAVDALYEGSYQKAMQSLVLNRCVNDTHVAKRILDDYIEANKDFWPELK